MSDGTEIDKKLTGKTAFIQKNQTLSEFVAEELVRKLGMDVTVSMYKKTEHYGSGSFLPEEFKDIDKSKLEKQSIDDMEKMKEKEVSGDKDGDDGPKAKQPEPTEPKKEVSPKSEDKEAISKEVEKMEPEKDRNNLTPGADIQIKIPEAPASKASEIDPSVAKVSISGRLAPPNIRRSFFSGVEMMQTELLDEPFFKINYDTIEAPTRRMYIENHAKMVLKWLDEYSFLFGKMESEEEPVYKLHKITKTSDIGFDLHSAIKQLRTDFRMTNARKFLQTLKNEEEGIVPDADKRRLKTAVGLMTRDEKAFLVSMDAISQNRVKEIDELHSFMKLFKDHFHIVEPLKRSIDRDFTKFYGPGELDKLGSFMDNNFTIRSVMWDFWLNVVKTSFPFNLINAQNTYRELVQVMSTSSTVASKTSDYPARLSTGAGKDFVEGWLTAKLASRYAKLYVDVDLYDVSLSHLIQCICAKLMIAKHEIHPESLIMIDNYLAKWLLPSLSGYTSARDTYDISLAETGAVNYLIEAYNTGVIAQNNGVWPFLLTKDDGSGWANAGDHQPVSLPPSAVNLLNPRDYWYLPACGKVQNSRREITQQFSNFSLFVRTLPNRIDIASPHDRLGVSFRKLMSWLETRRYSFSDAIWYVNRSLRKMTLSALHYPYKELDVEVDPVLIPDDAIFSALAYMDVDPFTPVPAPLDLVHAAWKAHDDFNDFHDRYVYFSSRLTDDIYSRKDWIVMALGASNDSTGLLGLMKTKMIDEKEIKSVTMLNAPPTQDFQSRLQVTERFIETNLLWFGVVPAFYYSPNPGRSTASLIQRYLTNAGPVSQTLTYNETMFAIADERYAAILQNARASGSVVKFDFPVNYDATHVKLWKNKGTVVSLPTASSILRFNKVPFDYTTNGIVIDDTSADRAELDDTPWNIDTVPFIMENEEFLGSLIQHVVIPRYDITYVTEFQFLSKES